MGNIGFVGNSHLRAIENAGRDYTSRLDNTIRFFQLRGESNIRMQYISERIITEIKDFFPPRNPNYLVTLFKGNEHNVLGLVKHPRPFDFILHSHPELNLEAQGEIICESLIESFFTERMLPALNLSVKLRHEINAQIVVLQPPPPLQPEDVLRFPGKFKERLSHNGVSPTHLRVKLWLKQSEIARQFCRENDLIFFEAPAPALNRQGCLVTEAVGEGDPTHTNSYYGSLVLDGLDSYVSKQN